MSEFMTILLWLCVITGAFVSGFYFGRLFEAATHIGVLVKKRKGNDNA